MANIKQVLDGGNKEYFGELAKISNPDLCCEEFTWRSFNSASGMEFVALMLISECGNDTSVTGKLKSPLLEPEVTAVGISMKPSKNFQNIIQVLFVKGN